MERTRRFVVAAVGAVTLSAAVGIPRHPSTAVPTLRNGQTPPGVTWHFDSVPVGQPPAGFSFGRIGGGRAGPWVVESAPHAPPQPMRAEERRVGEKGRARGWPCDLKKKKKK